jgi:hypothetical protein
MSIITRFGWQIEKAGIRGTGLQFNGIAAFGFVQSLLESERISRSPLVFRSGSISDGAFYIHTR